MLSTTRLTSGNNCNALYCWGMEREDTLNTNTIRNLTNTEVAIEFTWVLHGNACALEGLNAGLLTFFNPHANFHRVTCSKSRELLSVRVGVLLFYEFN